MKNKPNERYRHHNHSTPGIQEFGMETPGSACNTVRVPAFTVGLLVLILQWGLVDRVVAFQFHEAGYVDPWTPIGVTTPVLSGATIAWADYNQDGRADYAVAGTTSNGVSVIRLYRSFVFPNGNINFTNTQTLAEEAGASATCLAWGDFNNDGWPDLAVAGPNGLALYQNNPATNNPAGRVLEPVPGTNHLQGVAAACLAWLDYNRDGSLDLVCSGFDSNQIPCSGLYKNIGHGERFERDDLISPGLSPYLTSLETGDYDADGYPDLLAVGIAYSGPNPGAKVILYHNELVLPGNISRILRQDTNFPGGTLTRCKAVWGDFNGDRLLDAFVTGYSPSGLTNRSYLCYAQTNSPGGWGWLQSTPMENPLKDASVQVGDLNHDGRTDLITMGLNATNGYEFNVFLNQGTNLMRDPDGSAYVPRGGGTSQPVQPLAGSMALAHSAAPGTVGGLDLLMVGASADGQPSGVLLINPTPVPTLVAHPALAITATPRGFLRFNWSTTDTNTRTFDLAIGRTNYGIDILSADSRVDNWRYRSIPGRGNMGYAREVTLYQHGLLPGEYVYGAIQAVDDSFNTSYSWHGYQSFATSEPYRLPYMLQVTNLFHDTGAASGAAAWGDFDNDGDLDLVMLGEGGGAVKLYINDGDGDFTQHPQCLLPAASGGFGAFNGSVEWGDANGDGYLDFLVAGAGSGLTDLVLYRNSGPPNFTFSQEAIGSGFYAGHARFGDYDNDGDLDIVAVTGEARASHTSIYRNDGPANPDQPLGTRRFTRQGWAPSRLIQLGTGANVAWCDFDNDGQLDLLVSGVVAWPDQTHVTKLYRNSGPNPANVNDWQWIEVQGLALPQVSRATLAWGDANADGFTDLFISGYQYNPVTENETWGSVLMVNRPLADNSGRTLVRATTLPAEFQVAAIEAGGSDKGQAVWGDINNDGRLDLIFATASQNGGLGHASIFLNYVTNGMVSFIRDEPVSSGSYAAPGGTSQPGDLPVPQGPTTLALGDYDGDGRLDLLTPYTLPGGRGNTLTLFHNNYSIPINYRPLPPLGESLQAQWTEATRELLLSWTGAEDNGPLHTLTPAAGLTYNFSLSATGQLGLLVAPNSDTNGWRRIAQPGRWGGISSNAFLAPFLQWTLRSFQPLLGAEYRFAVQSVDNGLMGSPFAATNFHYHAYITGTLNRQTAAGTQPLAGWTVFLDTNANNQLDAEETTVLTSSNGMFSFEVSKAGTYAVRQVPVPACWVELAHPQPLQIISTDAGHTFSGQDLLNQQQANLTGVVYYDRNHNGQRDAGEETLDYWDVFQDLNNNNQLNAGEPSLRGQDPYAFNCVTPGAYVMGITPGPWSPLFDGWQITEPAVAGGEYQINAAPGQTVTNNFGVWHALYESSTVYGHLWVDTDTDGVIDANEPDRLKGWKVFLDDNNNGVLDGNEANTVSGDGGAYTFTSVRAGHRRVRVEIQPGWQQTLPLNGGAITVNVIGGSYVNQDFGFVQPGQAQRLIQEIKGKAADGSFSFRLGTLHPQYRIESTDDLAKWTTNTVISTTGGTPLFKDNSASNHVRRFYRAVPQ